MYFTLCTHRFGCFCCRSLLSLLATDQNARVVYQMPRNKFFMIIYLPTYTRQPLRSGRESAHARLRTQTSAHAHANTAHKRGHEIGQIKCRHNDTHAYIPHSSNENDKCARCGVVWCGARECVTNHSHNMRCRTADRTFHTPCERRTTTTTPSPNTYTQKKTGGTLDAVLAGACVHACVFSHARD